MTEPTETLRCVHLDPLWPLRYLTPWQRARVPRCSRRWGDLLPSPLEEIVAAISRCRRPPRGTLSTEEQMLFYGYAIVERQASARVHQVNQPDQSIEEKTMTNDDTIDRRGPRIEAGEDARSSGSAPRKHRCSIGDPVRGCLGRTHTVRVPAGPGLPWYTVAESRPDRGCLGTPWLTGGRQPIN